MNTTVQIAIARAVSTDDRRTYVLFEGTEMVFILGVNASLEIISF